MGSSQTRKIARSCHENFFWRLLPQRHFHPTNDSRAIKHKTQNSTQNSKLTTLLLSKPADFWYFLFYPTPRLLLSFSILVLDAGVSNFFQTCFWLLISFEWLFGSGGNSVFRPFFSWF